MAAATPTSPGDVTLDLDPSGLNRIDGILSFGKWGGALGTGYGFTYSFQSVESVWSENFFTGYGDPDLFPEYEPWNTAPALSADQIAGIEAALAAWAAVADVTFTEVTDSDTVAGEIRFGTTAFDETFAHAYLPAPTAYSGDVWFGTWDPGYDATLEDTLPGGYGYVTMLHEIGHALGLDHPHDGQEVLNSALDFRDYTVMSYRDYVDGSLTGAFETEIFPYTPMVGDIAAIQYLYGPNMATAAGDDTYSWAVDELIFETIWDAGGTDIITWAGHGDAALINLVPGQYSNIGPAREVADDLVNANLGIAYGATIENATGGTGNDTLIGNDVGNILTGDAGADSLSGGAGADTLLGGTGNDTYFYDGTDSVSEAGGDGTDLVRSSVSYTLPSSFENLSLLGSAALSGTGNSGANLITGNSGGNVLVGAGGADNLAGGGGDDTYHVDGTDTVTEGSSAGTDRVRSALADYVLPANVEELELLDDAFDGTGNSAANLLLGNADDNVLVGEGGHDTLSGGAGEDSLAGGAGADSLVGGAGVDSLSGGVGGDTYVIDSLGDQIFEGADAGNDIVRSSISYTLQANLEQLALTGSADINGTGNTTGNVITGNTGDNSLSGLDGDDTLVGADGGDTMLGGIGADSLQGQADGDEMRGNAGADTLRGGAGADDMRGGQDGDQIFGGGDSDKLTGALGSDNLRGALGDDELGGGQGNDSLGGGQGNDLLQGGQGNDELAGGLGADRFSFAAAGSANADVIQGFLSSEGDVIELDSIFFTSLTLGALTAGEFGTEVLYDSGSGALSYDADGTGAGVSVIIATLEGAPALEQTQIFIA